MHYRPLGQTGIKVSEVGLGCNRLGQDHQPQDFWIDLVRQAADLGVTIYDTAEAYEWGGSEEVLGLALGNRDDVYIATKMSRIRKTNARDYSANRMRETAENSLRRLGRECIDIYQLHSPGRDDMERDDWVSGMNSLKAEGKIRYAAVAVNSVADGIWLIEQDTVDVLQCTYNIFNTNAEDGLFALAKEKGIGLLIRLPLAQGILSGKFSPGNKVPAGHRAHLAGVQMQARIHKALDLRPLGNVYSGGMTRLAHHFSLKPQAVSAIIPGAQSIEQLKENVAASNRIGLTDEMRQQVDAIRAKWED